MKKSGLFLSLLFAISISASSQIAINADGSAPDASAALDISYTTKGFLPPRLTIEQISAIPDPAEGLMVYCTTNEKVYIFVSSTNTWKEVNFGTGFIAPPPNCGLPLAVNHVAGAVAPVNKTVVYGTVTNIAGQSTKCWITSNLGADHQASAVNDATEASAGWYWQFNRKQGYKHDGVTRTPSSWVTSINEYSDWTSANDPCALLLGSTWRIPTQYELQSLLLGGNWTDWNGPWNSDLKLHAAGMLQMDDGDLTSRGVYGFSYSSSGADYWGAKRIGFGSDFCNIMNVAVNKCYAYTVRCLMEWTEPALPELTTAEVTNIGRNTATGGGNIISDGGSYVYQCGICWSTSPDPTPGTNNYTWYDDGLGSFTRPITGLTAGTLYYVRAYAMNTYGTQYGNEVSFTTIPLWACGDTLHITHNAGNVAPVTKSVIYNTATNIPGEASKCWLAQNLGSDQQAVSVDDDTEPSAGWYWQFNLKQGYKHDGTTRTPNTNWITPVTENSDWIAAKDPCTILLGSNWRIPTLIEWVNVDAEGGWTNWNGPFDSGLKLHAAGYLAGTTGNLVIRGEWGMYWASNQFSDYSRGYYLYFNSGESATGLCWKDFGLPLRCVKE